MHYRVLAILEEPSIDGLAELMEAYGDGREWDFYQVGGRWTGSFDGYDPTKDAANMEPCLIGHTGPTCIHCKGTDTVVKWPTQWAAHEGDKMPVSQLTEAHLKGMHTVVCDAGWFASERYVPWEEKGKYFVKQSMPPLAWIQETYRDGLAVVVDCHN